MTNNNERQLMHVSESDGIVKLEISVDDLVFLFNNSIHNDNGCRVIESKKADFVNYIMEHLNDETIYDSDTPLWGDPFEVIFDEIISSYENFIDYNEED